jgi:NarL family two-component system response regulator LiaR
LFDVRHGVSDPISVALVEDHALVRAGLRMALEALADVRVVGEASDGISAEVLIVRERPTVAIIDIGLPGRDGIALTRAVKASAPQTKVVILTMNEDDNVVVDALTAGADAYCVKSSDTSSVIDALRIVASGGAYFDPQIAHVVLRRLGAPIAEESPLTPRELDVLRLIAEGLGNIAIGERLQIGMGTVKAHISDILEKLSASDRTQAAVNALRRGLL